jgi:hypothetical protein
MKNFQNKTKIIKVSGQLRAVARLAIVVWGLGIGVFLLAMASGLRNGGNARTIYLASGGLLEMGLAMVISRHFFRVFDRLYKGELFDATTVGHLYSAGLWWLGCWALDWLFAFIGNGWFGTNMGYAFGQLFASLVVVFVAWLLKEAQDLQAEQALTV